MDAFHEVGPGKHFFGSAHTLANYKTAYWESELSDNDPFEQWSEQGGEDSICRANRRWKTQLKEYTPPPMDEGINEALSAFIDKKKASMEDAWY